MDNMFKNVDLMTAIVTPFDENNKINFPALKKLIDHLLKTGSRGFVVGATTGETPELSDQEKIELYTKVGQMVPSNVPIIAGVGTNNTKQSIEMSKKVGKIKGIDVCLEVVPYYNKPDQRGMFAHFTKIAAASPAPIMMYNIPGRTGVKMANDTIVKLSHNPNIIGVKQCGTMADMEYLVQHVDKHFVIYSGEDPQALFTKMVGGNGVISVASHIYGKQMRKMYDALYAGDYKTAGELQCKLTPVMGALFMYPSPSPTKAVLNAQGFNVGGCRMPLLALNKSEKQALAKALGLPEDALLHSLSKELNL